MIGSATEKPASSLGTCHHQGLPLAFSRVQRPSWETQLGGGIGAFCVGREGITGSSELPFQPFLALKGWKRGESWEPHEILQAHRLSNASGCLRHHHLGSLFLHSSVSLRIKLFHSAEGLSERDFPEVTRACVETDIMDS